MDENQNLAETILKESKQPQFSEISLPDGKIPTVSKPDGWSVELHPELLPAPLRKVAKVRLDDAESFIWYLKEHGSLASCRTYLAANYSVGSVDFTGVINDNTQTEANWRDHRAIFSPAKSEEWNRWIGSNGKKFSQVEFATFLEENLQDIAQVTDMPTGADIMAMAIEFEATADKKFKSGVRLQSGGVNLEYIDQEDSATREKMKIFERFSIGIPPFFNGDPYRIDARLKYSIRDAQLKIWYELVRPDKVLEAAAKDLVQKIKDESGFPLLAGAILG